jgi:nucleosome binding factor SPN SPT16 subunit
MFILSLIVLQNDEDKTNFQKVIDALKRSKRGKTLGVFSKDNYPGQFMDSWRAVLKKEHFDTVSSFFPSVYVTAYSAL